MKLRLTKAISLYEAFLQENSEFAVSAPVAGLSRDSMIKDVDTIINSLETLATQIAEDLENEPNLTEAGEESATKKVADYLIFAGKYKKMQQKINAMKISKLDLEFAAKAPGTEAQQKTALTAKATALTAQIKDLQDLVNDKAQERGEYVQKVLSKTKIEGQMELIKQTLGADPSATAKQDLSSRMAGLKQRYQEEVQSMKKLEDEKPSPQKTKDAEKATDKPEKKPAAQDDKTAEVEADIKGFDKNISDENTRLSSLQKKLKEIEDEKSKSTNPDSFDQQLVKAKEEISKSKEDLKEMQAEKAKLVKQLRSNESTTVNEAVESVGESINKNALLNRAEVLGLTALAEEISKKEEWQLNKTALYSKFDTEIKKAEYDTTLQADKYTVTSVKDKFSKLI